MPSHTIGERSKKRVKKINKIVRTGARDLARTVKGKKTMKKKKSSKK